MGWITKVAAVVAIAAYLVLSSQVVGQESPAPFRELFNGQNLDGWAGDEQYWSVQDGVITGRTTPDRPLKQNTFLIWKGGRLRDFELHVSFKISGGNSGVQYRSRDMGNFVVSGYQADIVGGEPDKYTGILYEEKGRGILAERGQKVTIGQDGKKQVEPFADGKEIAKSFKKDDWNHYVIVARGNHLVQTINGVKTAEVIDNEQAKAAREGILALQIHTGPPMTVQFKDIRLKALTDEPTPPAP